MTTASAKRTAARSALELMQLGEPDTIAGAVKRILTAERLKAPQRLRTFSSLMRYDLTQKVLDLDSKPIIDPAVLDPSGKVITAASDPYTLGLVLFRAALFLEQGSNPSGEEKFKSFKLAEKIKGSMKGMVSFSIEETADLKERVGKIFSPTIVGRVWPMLESGAPEPSETN